MEIIDRGSGPPLVLIPGIQGRWEYLARTIDALAPHFRVITFPLCDEPAAGAPFDESRGMDSYADQVDAVLDACGLTSAIICGVSFGGLVALTFAATRPQRTSALVLVSAPGPEWHLKPRHETYARYPWIFGPLFAAEAPLRLRKELAASFPDRAARLRFTREQATTFLRAPLSPARMAARARLIGTIDRRGACRTIAAPTLIIHGLPDLDYVVDVSGTASYAALIPNARVVSLDRSGHLGCMTRADEFAAAVRRFALAPEKDARHSAA